MLSLLPDVVSYSCLCVLLPDAVLWYMSRTLVWLYPRTVLVIAVVANSDGACAYVEYYYDSYNLYVCHSYYHDHHYCTIRMMMMIIITTTRIMPEPTNGDRKPGICDCSCLLDEGYNARHCL